MQKAATNPEQSQRGVNPTPDGDLRHVKGIASDVTLDATNHEAVKRYRRQPLISALYRLVFQAPFPYVSNVAALKAAKYRRRIAGIVTEFVMGRDVIAPVKRVEQLPDGRYVFVTELVEGGPPQDRRDARRFLHDVTDVFIKSGLPTWQVSPYNPRSVGNVMQTTDGDFRIIDLESNVVTPMVPLSELWSAASTLHLPPFDDIDIPKLLRFYEANRDEMTATLGEAKTQELALCVARYVWYEDLWQKSEPRIFSRALRLAVRFLDVPAHIRKLIRLVRSWSRNGTRLAEEWAESGIERWRREGVITGAQAERAREDLQSGPIVAVLGHLGAHLAMSIPLRFPLGSAARVAWSAAFRVRTELRAMLHRAPPEETDSARGTHSLPVIAASGIPGLGAAAYVLAAPLRKNQVLLGAAVDQALRLAPFRLYERFHLRAVTIDIARRESRPAPSLGARVRQARHALADLWPHRWLIGLIFAVNASALTGALIYLAAYDSLTPFSDYGPLSLLMIGQALLAGGVGIVYYRAFWSQRDADERPGAAGTLFWFVGGLALIFISVDVFFGIHRTIGGWLDGLPILTHTANLCMIAYVIAGVVFVRAFGHEVESNGATFLLLTAAAGLAVATVAIETLLPSSGNWLAIERAGQLLTVAPLLPAFVIKYRELPRAYGGTAA